jgi:diaminopimelate decarboxylase
LIDSFNELTRLERIASRANQTVRAGVRLTTDTSGLWRKFGIPLDALEEFWEKGLQCRHVLLKGLQFHTSWNLTPDAQVRFLRLLGDALAKKPEDWRKRIEFVDIGGGYWPEQGEWLQPAGTPAGLVKKACGRPVDNGETHYRLPACPIKDFAETLGAAIRENLRAVFPCRVCFEPGRWICNDAMHLFVTVVDKKANDLVITDAGTNAIGWERFETDYAPILNLTRPETKEKRCLILGALCTPHDVWGYSYWGGDIQPGDVLMIPNQGAYTYSLRQNFIKPLPGVVTV